MAVEIANAVLNITPSLAGLSREIDRQMRGVDGRRAGAGVGEGFTSGFKGAAAKLTGIVAGAFAAVKIKDFATGAIQQASDMAEVGTKLTAIYGSAAGDIEAFGARGAKALGQTSLQAKNAAATFGTFGKAAGLSAKENAAFSTQLATLATDMASFSNTTPEQAIEALGAGLRGESEPLRAYGVLLDDASLRNEALAMGLISTTKEALTPQQKVLASHALIMKQTTDAQGDFARTSGGLANQQRILSAQWEDAKGKLGEAFLPGVTAVVSALNEHLGPAVDRIVAGLPGFVDAVKAQFDEVKGYASEAWSILSGQGFQGGKGLEEDSLVVQFLFTLRDFGLDTFEKLRGIWDKLWAVGEKLWPHIQSIASSLGTAFETLSSHGLTLWDGLFIAFDKLADVLNDYLVPAFEWLARFMRENPDSVLAFVGVIGGVIAAVKLWSIAQAALNVILAANPIGLIVVALAAFAAAVVWAYNNVEWFRDLVDGAWKVISTVVSWAWDNVLKPVLGYLWDRIRDLGGSFQMLWDTVRNVWTWISDKVTAVWNWIRDNVFAPLTRGVESVGTFFSDLWTTVQDVWTWIQDKISAVWNWLNQYVFAPMNLAINTVGTFFSGLWTTVQDVWGKISTFFGDVAKGISDAVTTVKDAIKNIKKAIDDFFTERLDNWGGTTGGGVLGNIELGPGGARGLVVPGRDPGRRDNMLMPVRSEEAIMVPEFTHAVGGAAGVFALNRAAEAGLLGGLIGPGMARGGVVGQRVHDRIVNAVLPILEQRKADLVSGFGGGNVEGARGAFLQAVLSKQGTRYVWGAAGPDVFDCSGLMSWGLNQAGVGKGRLTAEGFNSGFPATSKPKPGDMVTFDTGRLPGRAGHIGAVLNPAAGTMMHTDGAGPARIQDYTRRPGFLRFVDVIGGGAGFSGAGGPNGATGDLPAGVGGSGVDRWRGLGLDVLAKVGAYRGMNLLPFIGHMMNQIRTESGGNPNAVNNYDRNAQRGDPSVGLLQVIGSTFRNALRGTPFEGLIAAGQRDPRASLTASTLYSLNRYGSLDRAWRGVAYARGGIVPDFGGGVDSVRGWLTPGEGVFTPPQTDAILTHARALEAGYAGMTPQLVINLDDSDPLQVAVGQMIRAGWAEAATRVNSVKAMS